MADNRMSPDTLRKLARLKNLAAKEGVYLDLMLLVEDQNYARERLAVMAGALNPDVRTLSQEVGAILGI